MIDELLNKFDDISSDHWANNAMAFNVENSYMKGDAGSISFRPNDSMTRAELAQLLYNLDIKSNKINSSVVLTDIKGHWGEKAINAMGAAKVISGYSDSKFKPDNQVTRAEAVTMISRLFDRSSEWSGNTSFKDVASSHWAYKAIMNAVNGNK